MIYDVIVITGSASDLAFQSTRLTAIKRLVISLHIIHPMASTNFPQTNQNQQKTFDFTKRKRWADLLVTELTDGMNLILSTSCIVLYCGPAVTELIGWHDTELLDRDLLDLITPDDRATFRECFLKSLEDGSDLFAYVRFQRRVNPASCVSQPSSEYILFEMTGRPYVPDTEGMIFVATAKLFPSRNAAALNTYLELKIANEQLRRRLVELQSCLLEHPTECRGIPLHPSSQELLQPEDGIPSRSLSGLCSTDLVGLDASGAWSVPEHGSGTASLFRNDAICAVPLNEEDDGEEGSKKKKAKKMHTLEQYVCTKCGRTDSPEWRKGPRGPKTLCNACGLRWAKQVRKGDDAQSDSFA